jgi:replicative DNA helicase
MLQAITSEARVNVRALRDGFLPERDFPKLTTACGKFLNSQLIFYDALSSTAEIYRQVAFESKQVSPDLLVVDEFQDFIPPTQNQKDYDPQMRENAELAARQLERIAKDFNLPILVLGQISKEQDRRARSTVPRIGELRDYGALEYRAKPIIILHKVGTGEEELDDPSYVEECMQVTAFVYNNRYGTGNAKLAMSYFPAFARFESAAKVSVDEV